MIVNNVHATMHVSRRLACSPAGGGSYRHRMIPAVAWWGWLALPRRTKLLRAGAGGGALEACVSRVTLLWAGDAFAPRAKTCGPGQAGSGLVPAGRAGGGGAPFGGWDRGGEHRARRGAGVQPGLDVGPCRAGRAMWRARLV
jgi:hypothetical protein